MSSKYPATSSFMERSRNLIQASRLSRLTPSKTEDHYTPDKKQMGRDYSITKSKGNLHDKLESILKHNSHLLSENNKLVQVIRDKDQQLGDKESTIYQVQAQLHTARNGLKVFELQRNRAMVEFRQDRETKESEISQILTHNDMLKSKLTSLEAQHKIEIISLKDALMRETRSKVQYLKTSQFQQNQQSQRQISQLKNTITSNNMQFQHRLHSHSMVERQFQEEIRVLQSQLKRVVGTSQLQLQQARLNYENMICEQKRQASQSHEKQLSELQMQTKRLKKEIIEKALQNDRLDQQLQYMRDSNKQEYEEVNNDKLMIEIDRHQMQIKNNQAIADQKHKLSLLANSHIQNLEECHKIHSLSLESQKNKLINVNRLRQEENSALQSQLQQTKGVHQRQIGCLQGLVSSLQSRLDSMEKGNKQESQFLKVKVSQLHQNDVCALINSHQIQVDTLCDKISKLQCRNKQTREKLHKQLEEKTQMRKHYQIEISKIGHKNTDLKLRVQMEELKAKENTEIMLSRNNIVSLEMLKDTQVNKKDINKRDGDISKLQDLIESKDKEIHSLNEVLNVLKANFQEQLKQCSREIYELKSINQSLEVSSRREKQFYQKQIRRRQIQFKSERETLENQLSNIRVSTYQTLMQQLGHCQEQNARLQSMLTRETQEKQNHLRAVNTYKEMTEIMQLESSSALQIQGQNIEAKESLHHSKKEECFNLQLQSKNKEIEELKRRLIQKSDDLQQLQRNHCQVQGRLKVLMEKAASRTDLENRVINLGMDTNLLQNKAQLFS